VPWEDISHHGLQNIAVTPDERSSKTWETIFEKFACANRNFVADAQNDYLGLMQACRKDSEAAAHLEQEARNDYIVLIQDYPEDFPPEAQFEHHNKPTRSTRPFALSIGKSRNSSPRPTG